MPGCAGASRATGADGGFGAGATGGEPAGADMAGGGCGGVYGRVGFIMYLMMVSLTPDRFSSTISSAFRSKGLAFCLTLPMIRSSDMPAFTSRTTSSIVSDPVGIFGDSCATRSETAARNATVAHKRIIELQERLPLLPRPPPCCVLMSEKITGGGPSLGR